MTKSKKSVVRVLVGTAIAIAIGVVLVSILNTIAGLPDIRGREPSQAITNGADTALGTMFASELDAHPNQNGIYELPRGLDAFAARAVLAEKADRSIDTQ
jgi:putative cardiolipin synthase